MIIQKDIDTSSVVPVYIEDGMFSGGTGGPGGNGADVGGTGGPGGNGANVGGQGGIGQGPVICIPPQSTDTSANFIVSRGTGGPGGANVGGQGGIGKGAVISIPSQSADTYTIPDALPYHDRVSFPVPLPTDTFLLTSKGHCLGNLTITASSEVINIAQVDITMHYDSGLARERTKISIIETRIDHDRVERGVNIFAVFRDGGHPSQVSVHWAPRNRPPQLLTRPRQSGGSQFWRDFLEWLNGKIQTKTLAAERLKLSTSNAAVSAEYWVGRAAEVHTTNAPISGTYHATDSVNLETINGNICVHASLDAGNSTETKELIMRTSNGALSSSVELKTSSESGGSFRVKTNTSNARLEMQVESLPAQSVLTLEATTTNSQASVTLPAEYQGHIQLQASNSVPLVHRRNSVFTLENFPSKGKFAIDGKVYKDKGNMPLGKVTLQTSNAPATMYI
ncbi:hypothetical protein B0H14DRAFT_3587839 [Mycena olivaceomarginata]|nr:hypothetical protein B0H14DRAFT_3587839 [Mycena olivaceomarginata]